MLINKFWAVCEAKAYSSFNSSTKPVAFLSDELCKSLIFFKPNLCDLIIKNEESKINEKYEFYVLPQKEKENKNNIFYNPHTISIPSNIYHQLLGYKENPSLLVRTDLF